MRESVYTEWMVGYGYTEETVPQEMIKAAVPGAVQLDYGKAHQYGSYTYGDNWKEYGWMEDVYWTYTTQLPTLGNNENKLYFVSKGIDYQFKIYYKDCMLYEQEGMFKPFELEVTKEAKEGGELRVVIYPVPKRKDAPVGKQQADQSCKPSVSYGWDWHPRLIPSGIWDDTYFELRKDNYIQDAEVCYTLNESLTSANIKLEATLGEETETILKWVFYDKDENIIYRKELNSNTNNHSLEFKLEHPKLWWPNGEGEATLYTSCVQLYSSDDTLLDEKISKVGFRRVRLVMHPGAWDSPKGHPITRSNPPITMEINGRCIFCKGTNWVNPEIFPGTITKETYLPLLQMAKDAHMNLIRSWGGGIINKESFFELCDEYGLMVWQEFPLACNNYEGTPHYLTILHQESVSIITRLRRHPCVVLWCGGNELFNAWSGMTDQSLALRLLNHNCYDLDPHTPFLMTSPLMGMAHGNYLIRYQDGQEVFQVMPKSSNTAYTEFGCPGPSPVEYLKTFIPEEELFPPHPGTVWESHHAFGAWVEGTWLQPKVIEHYFGKAENLEQLVEWGQILQCEGYKCIYEEARRQKPKCAMALNWCYNEPWPTAANNSLISWPAIPKPAYYAVKNSCRPILASARIPKFSYESGQLFSIELWILNDSPEVVSGGLAEVYLKFGEEEIKLAEWNYPPLAPNTNILGPNIRYMLPIKECNQMTLILRTPNDTSMESEYILVYSIK